MSPIILHHYQPSPFAEKIRAILAYKKLPWCSVDIPVIMPKPDLTALTGGYRKTPVLQIGSDIYCDTRLIARVLDGLSADNSLYPATDFATANIMAQWADQQLFSLAVGMVFSPAGVAALQKKIPAEMLQALTLDRAAMRKDDGQGMGSTQTEVQTLLPIYLQQIDEQLQTGKDFLFADTPCIADFSVYHCLWFIAGNAGVAASLLPYKNMSVWLQRMSVYSGKQGEVLSAQDAITIAKDAPICNPGGPWRVMQGFKKGDRVTIAANDIGCDAIAGELVISSPDEIAIQRQDPRAGEVIVHFPRVGYLISAL
jgi:glutathione S-transferase